METGAMFGMLQSGGMMGQGMMSGQMGGVWLIVWLILLLVLIGLTVLVVWAVRKLTDDRKTGKPEDDALAIARQRYARGEIDREEFRALRSDLTSG